MISLIVVWLFIQSIVSINGFQCQNQNEIFNFSKQACQQCDSICTSCFGLSQFECIQCKQDFYKLKCDNSCSSDCKEGMYKDSKSMMCEYCSVFGCIMCTVDQKCLKCDQSLVLDTKTGQCIAKQNMCPDEEVYSIKESKCTFICNNNQVYGENNRLCNPIQNCNQIVEQSAFNHYKNTDGYLYLLSNNKLVSLSQKCSFYIYNDNLEVEQYIELQEDGIQSKYGALPYILVDDIALCENIERLIGYNFVTKQIEFKIEGEMNTQYMMDKFFPDMNIVILYSDLYGYLIYDYKKQINLFKKDTTFLQDRYLVNKSNQVFLVSENDNNSNLEYYVIAINQNLYYKFDIRFRYCYYFSDLDRIFIVRYLNQIQILQFSKDFQNIKEIYNINVLEESNLIYTYEQKKILMIIYQIRRQIQIYRYSDENQNISLLMNLKSESYLLHFEYKFIENENNQLNLLVISNSNAIYIINLEHGLNNDKNQLESYLQYEQQYSDTAYFDHSQVLQSQNIIYLILKSKNSDCQIYKRKLQFKDNKIIDLGSITQKKIINELNSDGMHISSQVSGSGLQSGIRLFNNKYSNHLISFDVNVSLQTINIVKTYIKEVYKIPSTYSLGKVKEIYEGIFLYQQTQKNNDCIHFIFDSQNDSITFQFTSICGAMYNYFYIQKRKFLFDYNVYTLYDIGKQERIQNFSTEDNPDFAESLIFQNYNGDKLIFSDQQGKFFAFDLQSLKFQVMINDNQVKITQFYEFSLQQSRENYRYLVINNGSIYVQVNNQFFQEFSLQSNTLNNNQQITFPEYNQINCINMIGNIYINSLILLDGIIINIYKQNLVLVDTINLPSDTKQSGQFTLIDQYLFFEGSEIFYRLDLNTKSLLNLHIKSQSAFANVSINQQLKIIFFGLHIIQYEKMVLLKTNEREMNKNQIFLTLRQNSLFFGATDKKIFTIQNVENNYIQLSQFKQTQQLLQAFIQLDMYIAYYYDSSSKEIAKYDILSNQVVSIYQYAEQYINIYPEPYLDVFIYTQSDGSLNIFNPNSQSVQISLIKKFTQITRVQICFNLFKVIVQTSTNEIFILSYKNLSSESIKLDLSDVTSKISQSRQLRFQVQCFNNLIYIESPFMMFYTLDGQLHSFQIEQSNMYQNSKASIPIVDLQNMVIIFPHSTFGQYIQKNDNVIISNLFTYTSGTTKLYYDLEDDLLVVLTGTIKSITTVDCILGLQKQIYLTTSKFLSSSVDQFLPSLDTIIVVDTTPSIYLYNYKNNSAIIKTIEFSGCQSIIYFENNNFLILQTINIIHIYSFPNLNYIESLMDYNNPSMSNIKSMHLISQINVLFVIRQDQQILTYDLIQSIVITENNIEDNINIQYLQFDNDLIVTYSLQDISLSLFENSLFRHQLISDNLDLTLPKKCDLYKIDKNSFVFINMWMVQIIQINFDQKIFEIKQKLSLSISHSDTIYNQKEQTLIFISYFTKQIYQAKLSDLEKGIIQIYKFDNQYQQILISNQYIIYTSNNIIRRIILENSKSNMKHQLDTTNISFIKKLSQKQNPYQDDQIFNYDNENTYDSQENQKIIAVNNQDNTLYIVNTDDLLISSQKQVNYKVLNIVVDIKRQMIFCISNILKTYIYNYNLQQLGIINNPCFLDTKIFFDNNIIYSVCPNIVYFYNIFTLQKEQYEITKGFNDIIGIKSTGKRYAFILTQSKSITVIQFNINNLKEMRIIFQRPQKNLYIYELEIKQDINHSDYLHLKGISWFDIVEYLIPFQKSEQCLCQLEYDRNDKTSQLLSQIQENTQSSQQQISQIELLISNSKRLEKISLSQKSQKGIRLIVYSHDKQQNVINLFDGSIADDLSFNELVIQDLSLNFIDKIYINTNKNLKKLVMQNVNILQMSNQLIFEGFDTVVFTDLVLKDIKTLNKEGLNSLIIFKNCKKIIIKNIEVSSVNIDQSVFFFFDNVQQIDIQNLEIFDSNIHQFIQINTCNQLILQDSLLQNINNLSESLIQGTLIQEIIIKSISINNIQDHQIFNFNGCKKISIQNISITYIKNSIILEIQSYVDSLIYPTQYVLINQLQIMSSINVGFIIQSDEINIEKSIFKNISLNTMDLIYSQLTNIIISECSFSQFEVKTDYSIIKLNNYNSIQIQDTIFEKSDGSILNFLNQNKKQRIELIQVKFINNQNLQSQIILFTLSQSISILDSQFENNISKQDGGIFKADISQIFIVKNSNFKKNKSTNGKGGAIFMSEIKNIQISSSNFYENESTYNSGGALYMENINQEVSMATLYDCKLQFNKAIEGYGGSIGIVKINLHIELTIISNNIAAIGGGIYYQQIMPKIIQNKQIEFFKNSVQDNQGILYGNNIGSTIRKIKLVKKMDALKMQIHENNDVSKPDEVIIQNLNSGQYLYLENLQLIDEEEKYYFKNTTQNYHKEVLDIIQSATSLKLSYIDQLKQVKFSSDSDTIYQNNSFTFNTTITYYPNETVPFQIKSQKIFSLSDEDGRIIIPEQELSIKFQGSFRDCAIGEIQKKFLSNVVCEGCPDGKYSLNKNDQSCQICPSSANGCIGSTINLKNNYWRESEFSDNIIFCSKSLDNCQPESDQSKFGCAEGYIGPLCEQCDIMGEIWDSKYFNQFSQYSCARCSNNYAFAIIHLVLFISFLIFYIYVCISRIIFQAEKYLICYYLKKSRLLFISNSAKNLNSPVYSKILIDHLQIVSIVSSFQFELPSVFHYSSNVGGNPIQIQNSSFDCLYPNSVNDTIPLWFAKMLWSVSLPFIVIFGYYLIIYIKKLKLKIQFNNRYYQTAIIFIYLYFYPSLIFLLTKSMNCVKIGSQDYAQIDLTITCRHFEKHTIFVLFFSLPTLFLICFIIPVYLFLKTKQLQENKVSIISKSHLQFIYEFYQDQYYYWEFLRLIYKALIMILSILLSQYIILKSCAINTIVIAYFFYQLKVNPYQNKFFNYLETQSIIMCILTLNLCIMYQQVLEMNNFTGIFISSAILLINFYFISKVLLLAFLKPISSNEKDRNIIQQFLYHLREKYPSSFSFIQINYKTKFSTLLKIRLIKQYIKRLSVNAKELQDLQFSSIKQSFVKKNSMFSYEKFKTTDFVKTQIDNDEVNTEMDSLQQSQQVKSISNRYKTHNPVLFRKGSTSSSQSFLIKQNNTEQSQSHFRHSAIIDQSQTQFRLTTTKEQNDYILEEEKQ